MPEPHVLYRDERVLMLFKPSGMATTAPGGADCLVSAARRLDPRAPHLHPTSRLDAEVSGVVTFARTRAGNRTLLAARRRGRYRRLYVALCEGVLQVAKGRWAGAIAIDPVDPRKRRVVPGATAGARPAATLWEEACRAHGAGLLRLLPLSGRTHQLRVHAARGGLPLLGDVHYGGPRRVVLPDGRVVTPRRVMLHCAEVRIDMGSSGRPIGAHAPPPDDFAAVWAALGGGAQDLERASRL